MKNIADIFFELAEPSPMSGSFSNVPLRIIEATGSASCSSTRPIRQKARDRYRSPP